jgi:hypothetical protein
MKGTTMNLRSNASVALTTLALAVLTMGQAACAVDTSAAATDDTEVVAGEGEDALSTSDAAAKREISAAAKGVFYISETDAPFTYVAGKLNKSETVAEAAVRREFAKIVNNDAQADKPMASLVGEARSFASFRAKYKNCSADAAAECAAAERMNTALEKHLSNIQVFYFGKNGTPGHVEGVGVSIFIVGKSKSGSLIGVRTFAVWT